MSAKRQKIDATRVAAMQRELPFELARGSRIPDPGSRDPVLPYPSCFLRTPPRSKTPERSPDLR